MADLYIIAGPNGAGKTTAAQVLVPELFGCREFVNADNIARGLSPFNEEGAAIRAGRIMLERLHDLLERRVSFAFETTLSSRNFVPFIERAHLSGYRSHLIYLWLDSPEKAVARVAQRVSEGGHNIPVDVIERRYSKSLYNLNHHYRAAVTDWHLYNNMDEPALIASGEGDTINIKDEKLWRIIQNH